MTIKSTEINLNTLNNLNRLYIHMGVGETKLIGNVLFKSFSSAYNPVLQIMESTKYIPFVNVSKRKEQNNFLQIRFNQDLYIRYDGKTTLIDLNSREEIVIKDEDDYFQYSLLYPIEDYWSLVRTYQEFSTKIEISLSLYHAYVPENGIQSLVYILNNLPDDI